jgi:hypothetical protein
LFNSSLGPDYTVTIEVRGWEVISTKTKAIPTAVQVEKPSSPFAAFVPTQREPNALPPSSESEAKPVNLTRPKVQPSTSLVFYKTGKEVEMYAPQYERVYWTFETFKSLCAREAKRLYKLALKSYEAIRNNDRVTVIKAEAVKACKVWSAFIYERLCEFKTFAVRALEYQRRRQSSIKPYARRFLMSKYHCPHSVRSTKKQTTPSNDQQTDKQSTHSYKVLKIGTELHVFETERLYQWALKHYNIVCVEPTQSAFPLHVQTAPCSDPHTEEQPKTSFSTMR